MPFERVLKDASDIQKVYYVIKNKYLKAYTSEASKQTPQILMKATGYTPRKTTLYIQSNCIQQSVVFTITKQSLQLANQKLHLGHVHLAHNQCQLIWTAKQRSSCMAAKRPVLDQQSISANAGLQEYILYITNINLIPWLPRFT